MPFIDPLQQETRAKADRFIRLDEGRPVTFQVLEKRAVQYFVYWFKDSANQWVKYISPGADCPIAVRNRAVGKDSKQYIRPQRKYAVNVYDMTSMVTCPECSAHYWPQEKKLECACGVSLSKVKAAPVNEVRILERGYRLFSQLSSLEGNESEGVPPVVSDAEGKPLSITQYAVMVVRQGKGNETTTIPVPQPHIKPVNPDDFKEDFYPLPQGLQLTADEIKNILDEGVTLRDILAARGGSVEDVIDSTEAESLF